MTKTEVQEFIEQMEEMGDEWKEEDVERVYGDRTLDDALEDRKTSLGMFFETIGRLLNR